MAAGGAALKPLAGRTALITGATGALGRQVAEAYARAGARLVVSARREGPLQSLADALAADGTAIAALPCDLSRTDDVRRLAAKACDAFGGLDVLVNAAAVIGPIGPLWENDWGRWSEAFQINLCAAAQLCQLCLPGMPAAAGRGKIVNISGGGATSPRQGFSAYAAAKTALVRLSETLAAELAGRAVDVNCVAPGYVNSAMTRAVLDAGVDRAGRREYDAAASVAAGGQDGRERAAELCVFLASAASDGITGKLISARWDPWETLPEHRADLAATDVYTLRRILPRERGFSWDTT